MKLLIVAFLALVLPVQAVWSQQPLKGTWQGLVIRDGQKIEQANIIYFDFTDNGDFIGRSRQEVAGKDGFIVKKLKGKREGQSIQFKEFVTDKKKDVSGVKWCAIEGTLKFIDSTGYLEGRFTSSECRGVNGKIICYRTTTMLGTDPTVKELQSWRPIFIDDIKKGRKAPEIRDLERKNFKFQPIYFDYDKDSIRPEYYDFLKAMVKVVSGHTDLRILVTGNTDADGSDAYNIDLSQRRAQAIINFFVKEGLARDRIEIDFKGEAVPVGDNTTEEGKQLNRRVEFKFI